MSDERQGLLKMKGHSTKLSPGCSATPNPPLAFIPWNRLGLSSLVQGRSVALGKALSDLGVEAYPLLGNIYLLILGFLPEVFCVWVTQNLSGTMRERIAFICSLFVFWEEARVEGRCLVPALDRLQYLVSPGWFLEGQWETA